MENYTEKVDYAVRYLSETITKKPEVCVILGSGLSRIAEEVEERTVIRYRDIRGFPSSMVRGHSGEIISGRCAGKRVIMFNGRFHFYQGYPLQEVVLPVRVANELGAGTLIVTNASGGINRFFASGDIMLITDHINMLGSNPLIGRETASYGPIFVDMTEPYDLTLVDAVKQAALRRGLGELKEGVYLSTIGPSYETKAEISFFEKIGADAVGMSTVPEVIVANQLGMRVLGISVVANMACGISKTPLSHDDVLENVDRASERLVRLVKETLGSVL
ncbi:MAG: purine-nucleoside phosphorylase [Spirochaetes bacterium]|nr:purine-nucleoside phosphorylase [Spirochaetota bacterium]